MPQELLNAEIDRVKDVADETLELRMRLKDFMAILHSKWGTMCKVNVDAAWNVCIPLFPYFSLLLV